MLLSIVIPTGGRRRLLAGAIESCLAQDLPAEVACEIVVVDNTPAGSMRDLVEGFADERLRWVHAATPGVSEARNAGVREARGEYVAFLDDDEEASRGWAAALLAHARRGAVAVFGPIRAAFEAQPASAQAATRLFTRQLAVTDGADVSAWHAYLGTGNSLFDKAACLDPETAFDTSLSRLGGEDSNFLMSLVDRGVPLTWAADALVEEHVPQERTSLASLATRQFRNGQVRSLIRFRASGWRALEGVAWMGAGLMQLVGYGLAGLVLARHRPERAALYRLKAAGGAGKVLWMRPFWKLTYGRAEPATTETFSVAAREGEGPLVSIIVVSYRTRDLTLECLRSVARETAHLPHEILVVDNASGDGSAEAIAREFPDVRLIALDGNVGFARANNIAAEEAKGRYLLLLNPDTVVIGRAIERLVAFAAERPQAKIWGGRTLYGDRLAQPDLVLAPHVAVERLLPHHGAVRPLPAQPALQLGVLRALGPRHDARGRHRDGLLPADRARLLGTALGFRRAVLHVRRGSRPVPARGEARGAPGGDARRHHHPLRRRVGRDSLGDDGQAAGRQGRADQAPLAGPDQAPGIASPVAVASDASVCAQIWRGGFCGART